MTGFLVRTILIVIPVGLWSGCGLGMLQTARTARAGKLDASLGGGFVYNEMVDQRGVSATNVVQQYDLRYGVTEHLDLGFSFLYVGGQLDAKMNFMPPTSSLALAAQVGFGVAYDLWFSEATTLRLPLRLLASYELPGGKVTPYISVGYNFIWVFGYEPDLENSSSWAEHGDGILTVCLGVEFFTNRRVQLLVEYNYFRPLVDNRGDSFSFVDNHALLVGTKF